MGVSYCTAGPIERRSLQGAVEWASTADKGRQGRRWPGTTNDRFRHLPSWLETSELGSVAAASWRTAPPTSDPADQRTVKSTEIASAWMSLRSWQMH